MSRSTRHSHRADGFTLIEALVALSILAALLAPIGALIATNVRGTRSMHDHLVGFETGLSIMTALPDRDDPAFGDMLGETDGRRWRVRVVPFSFGNEWDGLDSPWRPLVVDVTVRSEGGTETHMTTVRLQRRSAR